MQNHTTISEGIAADQESSKVATKVACSRVEPIDRQPTVEISPLDGWRAIDFGELWQFRELLYVLVWRDLKVRYRQTLLGAAWVLGQPLIATALFTLIFNRIARIDAPAGAPYAVFVLAGLLPWNFFALGAQNAGNSLIGSTHLISKTYFPRLLVPMAAVLSGVVDFAVTFVLLFAMLLWYGIVPPATIVLFPLAVLIAIALAMGIGFWLSGLNVEYRDARVIIPFLMQIGLYVTPVVYPRALLPKPLDQIVLANPMTGVVETFRAAILGGPIPWLPLGTSIVFACVILVSGAYFFRRVEKTFADLL